MRNIFLLLFLSVSVFAISAENRYVQLMAAHVDQNATSVKAVGDVIVYYGDTILQSDRAVYDVNSSVLQLFGHVQMMKDFEYSALSDHISINLKKNIDHFSHLFLSENASQLWMRASAGTKKNDKMTLEKAFVSSCDVTCPDWHLEFSSLDYNSKTKWMNIWNPVLYMKHTPVFYLPYIGSSTDRRRRSGLLRPTIGLSSREGFVYRQPIFIAPNPRWDLELDPQIRALRGKGAYATFRFVDTPHSRGKIVTGYFKDKDSFVQQYNLKNNAHYGFQVNYESPMLFTTPQSGDNDGLYADVTYLKDPDYLNLQAYSNAELISSPQIQSRINYYYNTQKYYAGIYAKYFIDTSLSSNVNTLQSIPIIQLHRYQNRVFNWNALQYSMDYRSSNLFTGSGKRIELQEFNIPVTLYWKLFNNFLNFSISENVYYAYAGYHNFDSTSPGSYYSFFRNYHKIDIFSDLARSYGDLFHTLQLRLTYNKPSFSSENGYKDPAVSTLQSPSENAVLSATNYLYDAKGTPFLYYRIAQPIMYENSEHKYADLEQEVKWNFLNSYEFYTDLFYSYYDQSVSSATSHIKYSQNIYDIILTHFYKKIQSIETANFFTLDTDIKKEDNIWYANVSYDNLDQKVRKWELGVHMYRHCWDMSIAVKDEKKPILTSAGAESINDVALYFQINLVPFGGFEQTFEQEF